MLARAGRARRPETRFATGHRSRRGQRAVCPPRPADEAAHPGHRSGAGRPVVLFCRLKNGEARLGSAEDGLRYRGGPLPRRRSAAPGATGMTALRPLYVDHGAAAVRLEGPALIVEQPECAAGRFPLRLLSRVVVRGPVPWSMEALFACLAAGVPVTFLSLDGDVVGLCLGRDRPEESLVMLLDRLAGEPAWREVYGRWRHAAERRAIVETARRLGLPLDGDLRPGAARAAMAATMPG